MTARTILDLYHEELRDPRTEQYVHWTPGHSRSLSSEEFLATTAALADGLADLGVQAGDRVMLLCENRPEWHMADLAILDLGAADVPIYPTLTPAQIAYQAADSGAVVAVAETAEHREKLQQARRDCPGLAHVIQVEGETAEGVKTLAEVAQEIPGAVERFWERAKAIGEDDLATVVYTSGTTGEPKGAMLTHRNLVTNVREILELSDTEKGEVGLEFLPLCHMIERIAGYCYMSMGARRAYCSVYDVAELIGTIRPSAFASVPRVLEKIHDGINRRAEQASPLRRSLFRWAIATGKEVARRRLAQRPLGGALSLRHMVADRIVLSKIRKALGGQLKSTFCGGAALPVFVNEFFQAVGLRIQEAYGLTETSPVITLNGCRPGDLRVGSVGRPVPSYEIRLAEDGELLVRGPSVFSGYWNKPEQTAEAFDDDGWFLTGDIATIDSDGFIFITDRKKDLIVTSGGKNVAPQPIESELKRSGLIDNAVLIGDRRPCITALLSPDRDALEAWASDHELGATEIADLVDLPEVKEVFGEAVARVNAELARFEQIRRFRVLPEMLSIEGGQLTPTLKVKRRVVREQYTEMIEAMYAETTTATAEG